MALALSNKERQTASASAEAETDHVSAGRESTGQPPIHPIPQLQGPFEESIFEAIEGAGDKWVVNLDAQSWRRCLLEATDYERLCGRKWRQRAGERYHPFWKLTSQMSFGVYLLAKGLAKSDSQVIKILQSHVDEVDGFLGRITEDFLIIQTDVRTRIQYLSLPLGNLDVFDEMLGDRDFRLAMINYNEKIEHAINRFTTTIADTLKDIQKGKEAIGALWKYLREPTNDITPLGNRLAALYNAMLANTEGWNHALSKLRRKGTTLQSALSQLGLTITEMQRRVGVASRKDVVSLRHPSSGALQGRSLRERMLERGMSMGVSTPSNPEKPLPRDPGFCALEALSPRTERSRIVQKSAPNLHTNKASGDNKENSNVLDQAGSVYDGTGATGSSTLVPKIQRTLSRRLSKAKIFPKSQSVKVSPTRPATAPSRTLKSRSVSLEHLRAFRKYKKEPQEAEESPALPEPERRLAHQASAKQDTMKNQLLHYFKSDRVIEAWENTTYKQKISRRSSHKRDGPWSDFCTSQPTAPGDASASGLPTKFFENDLERQMAWLQEETESLNTYSLKPKIDADPRIHVLSVHATPAQESEPDCNSQKIPDNGDTDGDVQPMITALPSVPPPLIPQRSPRPSRLPG